jgi:hypothetical protein
MSGSQIIHARSESGTEDRCCQATHTSLPSAEQVLRVRFERITSARRREERGLIGDELTGPSPARRDSWLGEDRAVVGGGSPPLTGAVVSKKIPVMYAARYAPIIDVGAT